MPRFWKIGLFLETDLPKWERYFDPVDIEERLQRKGTEENCGFFFIFMSLFFFFFFQGQGLGEGNRNLPGPKLLVARRS